MRRPSPLWRGAALLALALTGCINRIELSGRWIIDPLELPDATGATQRAPDAGWISFQVDADGEPIAVLYAITELWDPARGTFVTALDPLLRQAGATSFDLEDEPRIDLVVDGARRTFTIEAADEEEAENGLLLTGLDLTGQPSGHRLHLVRPD